MQRHLWGICTQITGIQRIWTIMEYIHFSPTHWLLTFSVGVFLPHILMGTQADPFLFQSVRFQGWTRFPVNSPTGLTQHFNLSCISNCPSCLIAGLSWGSNTCIKEGRRVWTISCSPCHTLCPADTAAVNFSEGFRGGSDGKESTCNVGDLGPVPGLGRSFGERNSNPIQYSGLENSMDRGVWQAPWSR